MVRQLLLYILASLFAVMVTCQWTYAWFNPTHMTIGAIAYNELKNTSPRVLSRVLFLLKKHPYYQGQWETHIKKLKLSKSDRDKYLFMLAARWPDDVKGSDSYHDHPNWHFVNNVYIPQPNGVNQDAIQPSKESILTAYQENRQILNSNKADSVKAIALCWLFHLVGDVHMPLHAATLIDKQFPKGDKGGNLFKIKLAMSSPTISLHAFWDGILLDSDDYSSVNNLEESLVYKFPRNQLPQLADLSILSWAKESFQLAQDYAYRNNTLQSGTEEGVLLPIDYVATIRPIAERQAVLAGYRLTNELIADFSK